MGQIKTTSLGFIGGGRITRIFLQALANKAIDLQTVVVFDTSADVVNALKLQFPSVTVAENPGQAARQAIVFIALHPPVIMETLEKITDTVAEDAMVISLAPKITIEKLASKLKTRNISRMIPNATSYINEGFNPVAFSNGFDNSQKEGVLDLLQLLGSTFEVSESKLEAYAILSAMLPTYFWFQWKELVRLGIPMGLSQEESNHAIRETLLSSVNLYFDSGLSPEQVMDLIPVKPIGEYQDQITEIYQAKLMGLFEKIKP